MRVRKIGRRAEADGHRPRAIGPTLCLAACAKRALFHVVRLFYGSFVGCSLAASVAWRQSRMMLALVF
jgi:hypothetical protein